jgi:hypothetical protein
MLRLILARKYLTPAVRCTILQAHQAQSLCMASPLSFCFRELSEPQPQSHKPHHSRQYAHIPPFSNAPQIDRSGGALASEKEPESSDYSQQSVGYRSRAELGEFLEDEAPGRSLSDDANEGISIKDSLENTAIMQSVSAPDDEMSGEDQPQSSLDEHGYLGDSEEPLPPDPPQIDLNYRSASPSHPPPPPTYLTPLSPPPLGCFKLNPDIISQPLITCSCEPCGHLGRHLLLLGKYTFVSPCGQKSCVANFIVQAFRSKH